jgi:hypothetical protein
MTQDVVRVEEQVIEPAFPRHGMPAVVNAGAVMIEQERAVAEAQGKIAVAKKFRRNNAEVTVEFLDACKSPEFATAAFYAVPNRGSGESIRFAEEAARCYGNFEFGHRELSRSDGKSEVEVYAWDVERNNFARRQITIMHVVDTKNGPKVLRDQADIDNRIANVASKQVRGRILALLPKALVAAGKAECKKTLAGGNEKPVSQRIVDMTVAFSKIGVTAAMLEKHLTHKLDETTIDELADLAGIFNAIREGTKASEFFGGEKVDNDAAAALASAGKDDAAPKKPASQAKAETKTEAKSETKAQEKPAEAPPAADKPTEAAKPQEAAQPAQQPAQEPAQAAAEPAPQQQPAQAAAASEEAVF